MANHVKARRKALKLTQEAVAQAIGTTKATVMKLERGHMQLTEHWLNRLAEPLQCAPEALISETGPQTVPVIGKVSEVHQVRLHKPMPAPGAAEADPHYWDGLPTAPQPPGGAYRDLVVLTVDDHTLEPLLPKESLIYCAETKTDHFDEYLHQMVVVKTREDQMAIGRLSSSQEFGKYSLLEAKGGVVDALDLHWAAKVIYYKIS